MKEAQPTDRAILHAMAQVSPVLLSRYGRSEDCTSKQLRETFLALGVAEPVRPYLISAHCSSAEIEVARGFAPETNWDEVRNRIRRLLSERLTQPNSSGVFHESRIAIDAALSIQPPS